MNSFAQIVPQNFQFEMTAEDHFILGITGIIEGQMPFMNMDQIDKAIALDPNFARAFYYRGRGFWDMSTYSHYSDEVNKLRKKAIQDLNTTIILNPNFIDAYLMRAKIYFELSFDQQISNNLPKESLELVISDLNKALEIDPKNSQAFLFRGLIQDSLGLKKEATEDYINSIFYGRKRKNLFEHYNYWDELVSFKVLNRIIESSSALIANDLNFTNSLYREIAWKIVDKSGPFELLPTCVLRICSVDLNQAIELNPNIPESYYFRVIERRPDHIDDSFEDLNKAIQISPKFTEAYYTLAQLNVSKNPKDLKNIEKAISYLNQAIEIDSSFASAYYLRGLLKSQLSYHQKASQDFKKALKLIKVSPIPVIDDPDLIAESIQILSTEPKNANDYYQRGIVRRRLGDHIGALADLNRSIYIEPNFALAYVERSRINISGYNNEEGYSYEDQVDTKFKDLEHAIQLNPDLAVGYLEIAFLNKYKYSQYYSNLTFEEIFKDIRKGIKLDSRLVAQTYDFLPDKLEAIHLNPYSHINYSLNVVDQSYAVFSFESPFEYSQLRLEQAQKRINELGHSFEHDNKNIYYERGLHHLSLGNISQAIQDFDQLILMDDQDEYGYYQRALAYYKLKDYDKAITNLTQAIALNSTLSEAYFLLGLIYYDSGKVLEAFENTTLAIRLDYNFTNAFYLRSLIRRKLGDIQGANEDMWRVEFPYAPCCGGNIMTVVSNPEALFNQGKLLVRTDQVKGIELLKQAANLFRGRGNIEGYEKAQSLINRLQN